MAGLLARYVLSSGAPPLADIGASLPSPGARERWRGLDGSERTALLEQYRLYVEAAEKVSDRRAHANAFFLTLNTAVITAVATVSSELASLPFPAALAFGGALVAGCLAWFWIVRSYRQLNTAKYAVIGAIEQWLPLSPWRRAEWTALGEGRDPSRYWPLSHVEQLIPALFAVAYTAGLIGLALA